MLFRQQKLGNGTLCNYIGRRFVDEAFLHTYIHTIGIDFLEKVVDLEGQKVLLQIWDTAGQDRYTDNLSSDLKFRPLFLFD